MVEKCTVCEQEIDFDAAGIAAVRTTIGGVLVVGGVLAGGIVLSTIPILLPEVGAAVGFSAAEALEFDGIVLNNLHIIPNIGLPLGFGFHMLKVGTEYVVTHVTEEGKHIKAAVFKEVEHARDFMGHLLSKTESVMPGV